MGFITHFCFLLRVKARDADASGSPNSAITYSIYERKESGINKVFEVDGTTGQVRLKSSIAKLENQVYQFFVRASDDGATQPLHSDVPVEVGPFFPIFLLFCSSIHCDMSAGLHYEWCGLPTSFRQESHPVLCE